MVFREFKKVNILVEGQTEKEKEYFRYIKLKNHMRTRLPRTYQKSEMIYDDVDLKKPIKNSSSECEDFDVKIDSPISF